MAPAPNLKPNILLLSLSYQPFFDKTYGGLITDLLEVSHIKRAKTPTSALKVLHSTPLHAIIITDEGLTETTPETAEVFSLVKSYTENGGLVIIGLHFPNFVTMENFDFFFKGFGLSWKRGDYHRSTCSIIRSSIFKFPLSLRPGSLPDVYSMKALHVKDAREGEKMFVPIPGAKTQSHVFVRGVDQSQAAVAVGRVGGGMVVYVGDVNGEVESYALMFALCGFNY